MSHHPQVVQLRLAGWEWEMFANLANALDMTVEDTLREYMRLGPFDPDPRPEPEPRGCLRAVR